MGLWLKSPVFTHGQLYVAFSRATGFCNCAVHINDQEGGHGQEGGWWRTNNVVSNAVLGSTTITADEHKGGSTRTQ